MAVEVELKAHVQHPLSVKDSLESLDGISSCIYEHKADTYLCMPGGESLFRIRLEEQGPLPTAMTGSLVFTYKEKDSSKGIEVNKEWEFLSEPSQAQAALEFFLSLGYTIHTIKTKKGYLYTYTAVENLPPMTIELVEVNTLGWFLELEFIVDDKQQVPQAKQALLAFLTMLSLSHTAIEERYYLDLIHTKKPEA